MFRSQQKPVELQPIPGPHRVFTGSLDIESPNYMPSGVLGDIEVSAVSSSGTIYAGVDEFYPGDDLSTMDVRSSVAEDMLLIPRYRPENPPSRFFSVVDIPERTLNTPGETKIFDVGRFCARAVGHLATASQAEADVRISMDDEYAAARNRPDGGIDSSIRLERVSRKRVTPKLVQGQGSESPLHDAVASLGEDVTSDDVVIVYSDFNNADEGVFESLSHIERATQSSLWLMRPVMSSSRQANFDGRSNLTLSDYRNLQDAAAKQAARRDEILAGIAGDKLREFDITSVDPYRGLAEAMLHKGKHY